MQGYSSFRRGIIALFSSVLFAAVGFVFSIVLSTYSLWPDESPIVDALPLMLVFAAVAGMLAYRFPKVFNVFLWFMP